METTINQVKLANYLFSTTSPESIKTSKVENFPSSSSKRKLQTVGDSLRTQAKRRLNKEKNVKEDLPISSEMNELIKHILNEVDEVGTLKEEVGSHLSQPLNATSLFFPIASKIESSYAAVKHSQSALDIYVSSNKLSNEVKPLDFSRDSILFTQTSDIEDVDQPHPAEKVERSSPSFSKFQMESPSPEIFKNSRVGISELHHQLEIMHLRRKAKLEQKNGNLFVAGRYVQKALDLLLGINSDPLDNPISFSDSKALGDNGRKITYEDAELLQPTLSSNPFEILQTINDNFFLFDPIVHSKAGKIQRLYRKYLAKRIRLANRLNNIIRGFLVRLKYKKLQQLRCQCAVLIQRRFRIHLIRMHALATKIKQWYKIRKIVRDYQHKLFYYKMARHIQRAFRGFLGRKRAKWMRKRLLSAAIIQRNLRAYRVRNDRHFAIACIHRVIFHAVRQIQTTVRRVQARQRCQVKLIMENIRHNLRIEKERIVLDELLHLKKIELKYHLMTESGKLQAYFLKRKWLYRKYLMRQLYSVHQEQLLAEMKPLKNVPSLNSLPPRVESMNFVTPELIQMMESYNEFADGRIAFRHLISVLQQILVSSGPVHIQREMIYHLRSRFDPLQTGFIYMTEFLEWFDSEEADAFFDKFSTSSPFILSSDGFQFMKYKVLQLFRRFFFQPPRQEKILIQDMIGTFFPQYYSFHFQQKHGTKFICCQCLHPFLLFSDYIAHFTVKNTLSENLGYCSVTNLPANFYLNNYYQTPRNWRNQREIEYEFRRCRVESQYIHYFSRQQCFEEVISWNDLDVERKVMAEREEYLFDILLPILSTSKNLKAKVIDILVHYVFLFSNSIDPRHSDPSSNLLHVNHHQNEKGVTDNRFFLNDIVLHILAKSFQLPLKNEWVLNERFSVEPGQNLSSNQNKPVPGNDIFDSNQKASTFDSSAKNPLKTASKKEKFQPLNQKMKTNSEQTTLSQENSHAEFREDGKSRPTEQRLELIKWLNRFLVIDFPFLFMQNTSIDGSFSDNAADQHQFAKKSKGVLTPSDEKEGYCYDGNYTSLGEYLSSSFQGDEKNGNFQNDPNNGLDGRIRRFKSKVPMNNNVITRNSLIYDFYQNYGSLHPTLAFFPTITRNGFYRKVTSQVCHVIIRILAVLKRQMTSSLFSLLEFRSKYPRKISLTDDELKSKGLESLCRAKYDEDYEFYLKMIDLVRKKEKELDSLGIEKRKQREERDKGKAKGFWGPSFPIQLSLSLPFLKPYEAIHPQIKEISVLDHDLVPMRENQTSSINEEMNPLETSMPPPQLQPQKNPLDEKLMTYENYLSQGKLRLLKQNPLFRRFLHHHYIVPFREMEEGQYFLSSMEELLVPLQEIVRLSNLKEENLFILFHSIFCKFALAQSNLKPSFSKHSLIHFGDLDLIHHELKSWFNCFQPRNVPPSLLELTNSLSFKFHEFVSFHEMSEGLLQLLLSSKNSSSLYYLNSIKFLFLKWPRLRDTDQGEMAFLLSLRNFRRNEIKLCEYLPRQLALPAPLSQNFWLEISQSGNLMPSTYLNQRNNKDKGLQLESTLQNKSRQIRFSNANELNDYSKNKMMNDKLSELSDTEKLRSLAHEYFDLKSQHSYQFHREIADIMAAKIENEISYTLSFTRSGGKLVSREIVLVDLLHQLVGKVLHLLIPHIARMQVEDEINCHQEHEDLSLVVRKVWDKLDLRPRNDARDVNSELKLWEHCLWKSLELVIDMILHFLDSSVLGSCDIQAFINYLNCFQLISPKASDEVLRNLLRTYSFSSNEKGKVQLPLSAYVEHLLPFLRWQLQRYSAFSAPSFFDLSTWFLRRDLFKSTQVIARRLIQVSYRQRMQHQLEQSLIIMDLNQTSPSSTYRTKDSENAQLQGKEKLNSLIQNDKEKSIIIRSQLIAIRQVEEFSQTFLGKFYEFRIRDFVRRLYYFAFFQIDDFQSQKQTSRKAAEEQSFDENEIKSATEYLKSSSTLTLPLDQGIEEDVEGILLAHLLYGIYLHCEQFHHHYGRYQKRMLNTELVNLFEYIQNVEGLVLRPESLIQMIHKLKYSYQRRSIRWYDSYEIYGILRSLIDVPLSVQKLQKKKFRHDSFHRPIYRNEKNILEDTVVHMRSRARQQAVLTSMNIENISVPETNYRCFVLGLKDIYDMKKHFIARKIHETKQVGSRANNHSYVALEESEEYQQEVEHEEYQEILSNGHLDSQIHKFSNFFSLGKSDRSLLISEDCLPRETISYYLYARGYNFQDVLHTSLQERSFGCSLPNQCEGKFQLRMVPISDLNDVINCYIWKEKSVFQVIQKQLRRTFHYSKYESERIIIEHILLHDMSTVEQRGSEYLREILTGSSLSE